eukprot:17590-Chlamydomonas_euryale.AAC.10
MPRRIARELQSAARVPVHTAPVPTALPTCPHTHLCQRRCPPALTHTCADGGANVELSVLAQRWVGRLVVNACLGNALGVRDRLDSPNRAVALKADLRHLLVLPERTDEQGADERAAERSGRCRRRLMARRGLLAGSGAAAQRCEYEKYALQLGGACGNEGGRAGLNAALIRVAILG